MTEYSTNYHEIFHVDIYFGRFHLSCVGLTQRPRRGWWCFDCNGERVDANAREVAAARAAAQTIVNGKVFEQV